jgi:hypothetical protein
MVLMKIWFYSYILSVWFMVVRALRVKRSVLNKSLPSQTTRGCSSFTGDCSQYSRQNEHLKKIRHAYHEEQIPSSCQSLNIFSRSPTSHIKLCRTESIVHNPVS